MEPTRPDWWLAPLDYQSRLRLPGIRRHRPPVDPARAAVRAAAAAATAVVAGCLAMAVPCGVFAGVGLWFDDASTADAARAAAGYGLAAAVAAVPAVLCHRSLARRGGPPSAEWN